MKLGTADPFCFRSFLYKKNIDLQWDRYIYIYILTPKPLNKFPTRYFYTHWNRPNGVSSIRISFSNTSSRPHFHFIDNKNKKRAHFKDKTFRAAGKKLKSIFESTKYCTCQKWSLSVDIVLFISNHLFIRWICNAKWTNNIKSYLAKWALLLQTQTNWLTQSNAEHFKVSTHRCIWRTLF